MTTADPMADPFGAAYPENRPPPPTLKTTPLSRVRPVIAERITECDALPLYLGMLHATVGEGESGKTWLAVHSALSVARQGHHVIVLDGEMSAGAWLKRFRALCAEDAELERVHYAEMGDSSADVALIRATVSGLGAKLVLWDSALSLISRTAKSENDNAEVTRVYDRLREIVRDGPAGLIVDHTSKGSGLLVSRGASAKFNSLDVSYGVRLAEGAIPGTTANWSSIVSVEKDRHSLLGERRDRTAMFVPLGAGALTLDIAESAFSTNRLSAGSHRSILTQITQLDPPPKSGNDAHRRLGGHRSQVLAAFKEWTSES